jgi:hypothetical protein
MRCFGVVNENDGSRSRATESGVEMPDERNKDAMDENAGGERFFGLIREGKAGTAQAFEARSVGASRQGEGEGGIRDDGRRCRRGGMRGETRCQTEKERDVAEARRAGGCPHIGHVRSARLDAARKMCEAGEVGAGCSKETRARMVLRTRASRRCKGRSSASLTLSRQES